MGRRGLIIMIGTRPDAYGGIASVVSAYRDGGFFEPDKAIYISTHCSGANIEKLIMFAKAWSEFFKLLLLKKAEIVHAHVASGASFWRKACFLATARFFGVPTILHLHAGPFPEFYSRRCNATGRLIVQSTFRCTTKILVVSNALNIWVRANLKSDGVVTIRNPVARAPILKTCAEGKRNGVIIFLGQLTRAKGVHDLLYAMREISRTHPNARLVLCGDGDFRSIEQLITRLNLENVVEVTGWVDNIKKERILETSTMLVLPSYTEGLPMSILEAMSLGLPIVASRVGGIPDAVTHEEEGLLIEPGDVVALAKAIIMLLDCPCKCARMGMAGQQKVREAFTATKILTDLNSVYEEILSGDKCLF